MMNIKPKHLQALLDIAENSTITSLACLVGRSTDDTRLEEESFSSALIFIADLRHELGFPSEIDP